jgi:hypothetical protein
VFVALFIQQAKRSRRIVLSFFATLAVTYFRTLSHERHVLTGNVILTENFFFLILKKNQRNIIINVLRSSCKVVVISVRF